MSKLRYKITHNSVEYSINPVGEFRLSYEQEDEEIFYRIKLETSLIVGGWDEKYRDSYTVLKSIEDGPNRCSPIFLNCEIFCGQQWVKLWEGKFGMNDADFDEDKCTISVKVNPNDLYQCIEDNDRDSNILTGTTPVNLNLTNTNPYEYLACPNLCPPIISLCNGESVGSDGWSLLVEECTEFIPGTGVLREAVDQTGGTVSPYTKTQGQYLVYYASQINEFQVYDYDADTTTTIFSTNQDVRPFDLDGDYVGFYSRQFDEVYIYEISTDTLTSVETGVTNIGNDDLAVGGDYMAYHNTATDDMMLYQISTDTLTVIESTTNVNRVSCDGINVTYEQNQGADEVQLYNISSGIITTIDSGGNYPFLELNGNNVFFQNTSGTDELFHYDISTSTLTSIVTGGISSIQSEGDTVKFEDTGVFNNDVFIWSAGDLSPTNISNSNGNEAVQTSSFRCGTVYYLQNNFIPGQSFHHIYDLGTATDTIFRQNLITVESVDQVELMGSSIVYEIGPTLFEYEFVTGTENTVLSGIATDFFSSDCSSIGFYDNNSDICYYYRGRIGNANPITIWYREKVTTPCSGTVPTTPSGSGWILYSDDCATLGSATWVRIPLITPSVETSDCVTPPDAINVWDLIHCEGSVGYWVDLGAPFVYDRFRRLDDVIDKVAKEVCPDIQNVVSDFFQINPENPSTTDYVTEQATKINHLLIAQKSDVKRPSSTEPASKGLITWTELTDYLLAMFQVFWFIDENDNVRFEHIKYFRDSIGLDLTDAKFSKFLKARNSYKYDAGGLQRRDIFTWMEAENVDFVGTNIEYNDADNMKSACVGDQNKNNDASRITTDIDYIRSLVTLGTVEDKIEDDGFVIVATTQNSPTSYTIIQEAGNITGIVYNNAPLSWANLHPAYWLYERPVGIGWVNGLFQSFLSTSKTKVQDEFPVPFCCDDLTTFDPSLLIKGTYGEGILSKGVFSSKTDTINLELKF